MSFSCPLKPNIHEKIVASSCITIVISQLKGVTEKLLFLSQFDKQMSPSTSLYRPSSYNTQGEKTQWRQYDSWRSL